MSAPIVAPGYEIVGELGRRAEGAAYLARERSTNELVALSDPSDGGEPLVTRVLDSAVPASTRDCPICRTVIRDWRRFCGQCGADLSGVDVAPEGLDDREVVEEVLRSIEKPVDLIGRMRRSEGGGAVWFGRDRGTGEIMALDLKRKGSGEGPAFDVAVTATLSAMELADAEGAASPPAEAGLTAEDAGTAGAAADSAEPASGAGVAPESSTGADASPRASSPVSAGPPVTGEGDTATSVGPARLCPSCGRQYSGALRFCPDDGTSLRAVEQADSLVGEVIANRYHVIRLIGKGGMGQVYVAKHVRMGRLCAIKMLNRELSNDVSMVGRFSREATNASRINHGNVAHIYDFGETPEHGVYLAMEYVEGQPLSKIIAAEAPLPCERVIAIAVQVADALEAAHAEGVVHRDLTPNNIMIAKALDGADVVKVVDFGIAKATQDMSAGLTKTGIVIGTPQYMSPEQLLAETVDGRSDIYSMGCVLFEMLTGESPFGGATTLNQFARRLSETPPEPSSLNPAIWPDLSDLVLRMLARQRDERFENAGAVRSALRDASAGAPAQVADATRKMTSPGTPTVPRRTAGPGTGPAQPAAPARPPANAAAEESEETRVLPRAGLQQARRGAGPAIPLDETVALPAGGVLPTPPTPAAGPRVRSTARRPVALLAGAALVAAVAAGLWLATRGEAPVVTTAPPIGADPAGETEAADPSATQPAQIQPGSVRLTAALPAGATVRANGSLVTVTDGSFSLPPGEHAMRIDAPGHEPFSDRIVLESAREVRWSPRLVPVPARPAADRSGGATGRAQAQPPPVSGADPVAGRPQSQATDTRDGAVVTPPPAPVSFADAARGRIESFRSQVESRNLTAIRPYLTARGIEEFGDVFDRAGGRPLRVSVRAVVPDSTGSRATFLLRMDFASGGENLLPWTDLAAGFQKRGDTWQLITVDRN